MPCVYLPGPAPAVTVANINTHKLWKIAWVDTNQLKIYNFQFPKFSDLSKSGFLFLIGLFVALTSF